MLDLGLEPRRPKGSGEVGRQNLLMGSGMRCAEECRCSTQGVTEGREGTEVQRFECFGKPIAQESDLVDVLKERQGGRICQGRVNWVACFVCKGCCRTRPESRGIPPDRKLSTDQQLGSKAGG
jgi:hypothetical protein